MLQHGFLIANRETIILDFESAKNIIYTFYIMTKMLKGNIFHSTPLFYP